MSGVNRFVRCLSTAAAGLALGAPSALAESTSAAPAGSSTTVVLPTIDVLSTTPLSGAGADVDKVSLRTTGLYALDTFDVTNAFSVSAGGRLNVANIQLQDQLGSSLNETICSCTSIR